MNTLTPKRTFSRTGFALLIATLVSAAAGIVVMLPLLDNNVMTKLIESIGASGIFLVMYAPKFLTLLVFFLIIRTIPKCEWEKDSMSFGELVKFFVMTYAVSTIFNIAGMLISKASPAGGSDQMDMISDMIGIGSVMGFLIPVLIAPVLEELIFRKLMIDRLHNYGEKTAIIFTAVCFGLFHGNLTQFFFATSVGIFLGYIYCRTGNVWYTLIIHILLNLFGSLIMLLVPMVGGGSRALIIVFVILAFSIMAVMMISGLIHFVRTLKRKNLRTADPMPTAIPQSEVLSTVYLNAGVILFFVSCIFSIVTNLLNIQIMIPGLIPQA